MTDHGLTPDNAHVLASVEALTLPNRRLDRRIGIRGRLPGAVILLHGVNDPGASYETVEKGLCQGLNERLGRNDLQPGVYGAAYTAAAEAVSQRELTDSERDVYDYPDATLYQRVDKEGQTHSPLIPFYWGYRADRASIEKVPGTDTPTMVRGQYQHVAGHRLDHAFAKEGGFFPNATNNIPHMYGQGFRGNFASNQLTRSGKSGKYTFIADAPERSYFVLAAHRLAMLVRTMRGIQSQDPARDPSRDTITIMGHSQGTLIALLAQALLAQQGQRPADCLILVDSPYSVHEEKPANADEAPNVQTAYAKVQTLIDIVNSVTARPFNLPDLAELMIGAAHYEGRTGSRWTAAEGKRPPKEGEGLITFTERDNRGKVYCYFCPEDTVVALNSVHGIGTFGVPDTVHQSWTSQVDLQHVGKGAQSARGMSQRLPVMDALKDLMFYQRLWTRLPRRGADGKQGLVPVGGTPGPMMVRTPGQRKHAGPKSSLTAIGKQIAVEDAHVVGEVFLINGEALQPPHEPRLYGEEVVDGHVDATGKDRAGKVGPDRVSMDVALGHRYAAFRWVKELLTGDPFVEPDALGYKDGFNKDKHPDDQTREVRVTKHAKEGESRYFYGIEREETPREARARMASDPNEWEENNYHSGILNDTENHRWVTAMDVAVGQAVSLDDPSWRSLLLMMANWRYDEETYDEIKQHMNFHRLDNPAKSLLKAAHKYFKHGEFPDEIVVPMVPPPLVTSQTVRQRSSTSLHDLPKLAVPKRTNADHEEASAG